MTTAPLDLITTLREAEVIPHVLPDGVASSVNGPLLVRYPEYTISKGEAIPRAATLSQPEIEFPEADTSASYTIIMTDPDLLKKHDTLSGQVRHWLETGIKFDATSKRTTLSTQPVARNDYVPPSPAHGTGKHRYVFIAAKEPAEYTGPQGKDYPLTGPADLKDRMKWSAKQYIQEEGLTVEAVGWMEVDADLAATMDNIALTAEAIKNKVLGK
ncbi:YbhB/YbcL family Raf kinase inhibitor-like protein [Rhodotorula paludigena]|uniref:YbhB/YbcL family Raf kinase inhibitor-like protein n=1 Tax=Rhodotorula paludigena TaxID=86838 RepID=UPI0031822A3A